MINSGIIVFVDCMYDCGIHVLDIKFVYTQSMKLVPTLTYESQMIAGNKCIKHVSEEFQ